MLGRILMERLASCLRSLSRWICLSRQVWQVHPLGSKAKTVPDQSFGVNEVLLSSVLASVVFSLAAAQPLVIVGVTGTRNNLIQIKS